MLSHFSQALFSLCHATYHVVVTIYCHFRRLRQLIYYCQSHYATSGYAVIAVWFVYMVGCCGSRHCSIFIYVALVCYHCHYRITRPSLAYREA